MKPKIQVADRFKDRSAAFKAIYRIIRPLAKLMMHQGLPATESIEALKVAFVASAEEDFPIEGKEASNARVSILTGFDRNTTARIRDGRGARSEHYYNRAERCVRGWHEDKKWHNNGTPLELPIFAEENKPSFDALVKSHSGGVSPHPVLDEMLRAGMVKKLPNGNLKLLKPHYDQKLGIGPLGRPIITVVGEQIESMIEIMAHNVVEPDDSKQRLQQMHSYRNVSDEDAKQLNNIAEEVNAFAIAKMTEWDDLRMKSHTQSDAEPTQSTTTGLMTEGTSRTGRIRKTGISINFFDGYVDQNLINKNSTE